jgi:hypothetical protein
MRQREGIHVLACPVQLFIATLEKVTHRTKESAYPALAEPIALRIIVDACILGAAATSLGS